MPGPHGGELAVAQLGWRLDGEALNRVDVAVEDPPDRAVGSGDPADEPELLVGRRAGRAQASVEGKRAALLELGDRILGKARDGGAVAPRRAGGDVTQDVIEPGSVVSLEGGYDRVSKLRPLSRAKSMTLAV